MGKHHVRRAGVAEGLPSAETVKLPQPVHDDGIILSAVGPQPRNKPIAESVFASRRTKRMNGERTLPQIDRVRRIQ